MSIRHQLGWVVLCLALVPFASAEESAACKPWAAKIASVQGKVEARRNKSSDWLAVKLDQFYCAGDQIRVGEKSRAGIILANETLVRLDENTAITLTAIEEDAFSLVELLRGIAHFISRVPRSLKVNTPFVNAAIEGTEFVVAIANQQTSVTVFEGTVLTQNAQGKLKITNGETAVASAGTAPSKTLLAKPRDAVQWALYFPPVLDAKEGRLSEASRLLYAGRVKAAQNILKDISSGDAKSLQAIIAIVNNQTEQAFQLATQAVEQSPQSAATHIALSYVFQARLDLNQALTHAQQATVYGADNAIAWARLAELQLSTGELDDALVSAQKATQINSELSRTQSILGYALLVRINIDDAMTAFNKAITLDQTDPLPRLGLGLAKIRNNNLEEGRRDIEVATLLDPNNAIIRSYLGKAYFEEMRGPLDATQFEMAKALDPNDPTPYYYDAIRRQSENDPVGALKDLNKSIELNDNRAVYRSSLQLDQDEAARSASLARIYSDLGFEQLAVNEATKSLSFDPANHSAHRFLSEAYAGRERHEIAVASELFQSLMLQPVGLTVINPLYNTTDVSTGVFSNDLGTSRSDLSNLYTSDKTIASYSLFSGYNNTRGTKVNLATLGGRLGFGIAFADYKTDGFRENNDSSSEILDIFLQAQATNNLSVQAEYYNNKTLKGDIALVFDPDIFSPYLRIDNNVEINRFGFNYTTSGKSNLLGSFVYRDRRQMDNDTFIDTTVFPTTTIIANDNIEKFRSSELQHIYTSGSFNLVSGLSYADVNEDILNTFRLIIPLLLIDSTIITPVNSDAIHATVYLYSDFKISDDTRLSLGGSYDNYKSGSDTIEQTNYKFGLQYSPSTKTNIRLASFNIVNRPIPAGLTLEPTQVAGFNQYFDDYTAAKATQHSIAIQQTISDQLMLGIESKYRIIESPFFSTEVIFDEMKEVSHKAYVNWIVNKSTSVSFGGVYDNFENYDDIIVNTPRKIKTVSFPLNLSWHPNSVISLDLEKIRVTQDFIDSSDTPNDDKFDITNAKIRFLFPKRMGDLSIVAKNLRDKKFNYYNLNYTGDIVPSQYLPGQSMLIQLNLTLN